MSEIKEPVYIREDPGAVAAALARAQANFTTAGLDCSNPYYKRRYASLKSIQDAARKALAEQELCTSFCLSCNGKSVTVSARLIHSSGQMLASDMTADARDTSPQSLGSVITYLRRYTLASLLDIASGDEDDGEAGRPGLQIELYQGTNDQKVTLSRLAQAEGVTAQPSWVELSKLCMGKPMQALPFIIKSFAKESMNATE